MLEFALLSPLLFILIFAIIDLSIYMVAYSSTYSAAKSASIIASYLPNIDAELSLTCTDGDALCSETKSFNCTMYIEALNRIELAISPLLHQGSGGIVAGIGQTQSTAHMLGFNNTQGDCTDTGLNLDSAPRPFGLIRPGEEVTRYNDDSSTLSVPHRTLPKTSSGASPIKQKLERHNLYLEAHSVYKSMFFSALIKEPIVIQAVIPIVRQQVPRAAFGELHRGNQVIINTTPMPGTGIKVKDGAPQSAALPPSAPDGVPAPNWRAAMLNQRCPDPIDPSNRISCNGACRQ